MAVAVSSVALSLGLRTDSFAGINSVVYLRAPGLCDPLILHIVAMRL